MNIKKTILFSSLTIFSVSCGKKAQAQEILYTPTDLQGSQCGDPAKGTFTCDTDSVRLTYNQANRFANNWFTHKTIPPYVYDIVHGPSLNLDPGVGVACRN